MSATATSTRLLRLALPLVREHGFTRATLARSVLALPSAEAHTQPLSDTAVSALFGSGDNARKNLIRAWLKEGLRDMASIPGLERPIVPSSLIEGIGPEGTQKATVRDVLHARLKYNEPVLLYLPEAFALLASPELAIPPLDPTQLIKHAVNIADDACYRTGDKSLQLEWYATRGSLAAIYTAAELHQFTSPHTAHSFLDSLLDSSSSLKASLGEINLYADYIFKSWKGIVKSSGILHMVR